MEKDCGGEDIEYPDYGLRIEAAVINEIGIQIRIQSKTVNLFQDGDPSPALPKGKGEPS
jgi:hypothetical protein